MAANSYRNVFLTNIQGILASGNDSLSLGIGEIGIFDVRTNNSTTAPVFPTNRAIQLVQGNTDKKLPKGMQWGNQSLRSPEIPASPNIKFDVQKAQKAQNMVVTLGWDGVSSTKTMAPRTGKQVRLYLTLTGQPIANLVGGTGNHPAAITETFDLILPCVDECVDNCSSTVDCNAVADAIIDQLKIRKTIGSIPLIAQGDEPGLVKVTKITSCDTPSGLPTTDCTKYTLTIADNGDDAALGKVQAQYPTLDIKRISKNGVLSTYETTKCSGGVPSNYVANGVNLIPNCTDCPSGYNYVSEYGVFTIVRAGNIAASTIASAYAAVVIEGSVVKLGFTNGQSTFQVFSTASLTTLQGVVSTDVVAEIGTSQDLCVGNSGLQTAWESTGTCQKALKYYQLTVANDPCGSTVLTELQAEYASLGSVTLVENNTDTCTSRYSLQITSEESCVSCGDQLFTFKKPWPFGTSIWEDVEGNPHGTDCLCGIKFESAYVARDRKECYFQDVSYEVEPLFLYVSTNNPDFRDYSTLCNDDEAFPVTLIQTAKYRTGYGSLIADWVKLSNFYFNKPWYNDPAVRDAVGYELGVDLQGYYDQFTLTWKAPKIGAGDVSGFGLSQFDEYEFTVFFPAGEGAQFQTAINSWLTSVGSEPNFI